MTRKQPHTNRDGQRPDRPSIPPGQPTLPPLPCLQVPLYEIRSPPPSRAVRNRKPKEKTP
jgi:hypothetical protein